jgi:hypothetical protein
MLLETLVATTCLMGKGGCSEVTGNYYSYNKDLQDVVKNTERIGENYIKDKKYIIYVFTPVYAVISGKNASFKLHKSLILNLNFKQSTVGLQWTY